MSADLDSIISSAITSIDSGGSDGGDTGDSGTTDPGAGADVPAADSADAAADAGAEGAESSGGGQSASDGDGDAGSGAGSGSLTPEEQALEAELAELGLSAPKPGQRDNRIPYSRVRKIVTNAKTKWAEKLKGEHTAALSERDKKIQEYEEAAS